MVSRFVIPRANALRFVDTTNYPVTDILHDQTFDNRLLMDEKWSVIEDKREYLQKFIAGDPIVFQLTTNHNPDYLTISLLDQDGIEDDSVDFIQRVLYTYQDGSGNKVYNYSLLNYAGLGFRYIQITSNDPGFDSIQFTSEVFEFGDYDYLPYIQWQGSDRDGIYWDNSGRTILGFRAEIKREYAPSGESSVYEGFNFQPELLFGVSKRGLMLKSDPLPRFIMEKLKIAFDHYKIWVNGTLFNSNGVVPKITQIEYSNLYTLEHTLIEVEYEDYTELQEISGIVAETGYYLDDDGSIFDDDDGSKFTGS
jgi:hypothetical protein